MIQSAFAVFTTCAEVSESKGVSRLHLDSYRPTYYLSAVACFNLRVTTITTSRCQLLSTQNLHNTTICQTHQESYRLPGIGWESGPKKCVWTLFRKRLEAFAKSKRPWASVNGNAADIVIDLSSSRWKHGLAPSGSPVKNTNGMAGLKGTR